MQLLNKWIYDDDDDDDDDDDVFHAQNKNS